MSGGIVDGRELEHAGFARDLDAIALRQPPRVDKLPNWQIHRPNQIYVGGDQLARGVAGEIELPYLPMVGGGGPG